MQCADWMSQDRQLHTVAVQSGQTTDTSCLQLPPENEQPIEIDHTISYWEMHPSTTIP